MIRDGDFVFIKCQAADLFHEIKNQFIKGLEEQDWMDNSTRDQARIKVIKSLM